MKSVGTCAHKHANASQCPLFPRGVRCQADLAQYSLAHPPKDGVNFHDELNASAKSQQKSWSTRWSHQDKDKKRGRGNFEWELR